MSNESGIQSQYDNNGEPLRCLNCDSVVAHDATQCIMCGASLPLKESSLPAAESEPLPSKSSESKSIAPPPELFHSKMREKNSRSVFWMATIAIVVGLITGLILLRNSDSEITLALAPTLTPFPPTWTFTPVATESPTETPPPSNTPTQTPQPAPTDTPQPPRFHNVAGGETLFGLSLFYRVAAESIAVENDVPLDSPIRVGQELVIPWPTATPPLESIVMELNGEKIVADVTDCEIVVIEEGDSAYGLSAARGVPAEAIIAVNRLTEESIQLLHPGDTLCVPIIVFGDTIPPTAGPPTTPTATAFPAGPELLYPIDGLVVEQIDQLIKLQWVAVKDLMDDESYMVEVSDEALLDDIPQRAFTRDSSFNVPDSWRPVEDELHEMRWRVSIVQITGERSDGAFLYRYGGRSSTDGFFFWHGAIPTATPTQTPVPAPTIEN